MKGLTIAELISQLKKRGVKGYSGKKKVELEEMLAKLAPDKPPRAQKVAPISASGSARRVKKAPAGDGWGFLSGLVKPSPSAPKPAAKSSPKSAPAAVPDWLLKVRAARATKRPRKEIKETQKMRIQRMSAKDHKNFSYAN